MKFVDAVVAALLASLSQAEGKNALRKATSFTPDCDSIQADPLYSDWVQEGLCPGNSTRRERHLQTTSPFPPPDEDDKTFVVNSGPGLDTGCTFRSGGPLEFSVKIPRVFGNTKQDIDKLRQNGLISDTATLRMPAFDVDIFGAPGVPPEVDRVSFNGKVLGDLRGDNGIWQLNTFTVDLDDIIFPTDPGAGNTAQETDNVISIAIDVASGNENWCVAIDWASLTIEKAPLPVVLFHGIRSSGSVWNPLWVPSLNGLGIPNDGTLSMGSLDSIGNNANKIAGKVADSLNRWGVKKVNIVAHSKGGLDSRHYVENNNDVDQLIQIGTPNQGSPLADAIQAGAIGLLGLPITVIVNVLAGPAGVQLTTPYMGAYNLAHGLNGNAGYHALAGDYTPSFFNVGAQLLLSISGRPGDSIVPVSSVCYIPCQVFPSSTSQAEHSGLIQSSTVFTRLEGRVSRPARRMEAIIDKTYQRELQATDYEATAYIGGTVTQAGLFTTTLVIDEAVEASIYLFYPSGVLGFSLESPSGTMIDPAYAAANPNVVGFEDLTFFESKLSTYTFFNSAEVGTYTITITGDMVLETEIPFLVSTLLNNPSITLDASVVDSSAAVNQPLVFVATVTDNGSPVTGAEVQAEVALPDDTKIVVTLLDDGSAPDEAANDGIYTGSLIETQQTGNYRARVVVQGTMPDFTREKFVLATVVSASVNFNGVYSDRGIDSDSDGLFDELQVSGGVQASEAGSYLVLATLTDSAGNAQTVTSVETLSVGPNTVNFDFNGEQIFTNGVDGPYTLSVARLSQDIGFTVAILDEVIDSYTTSPYSAGAFDRKPLRLNGQGTTTTVDSNGNNLIDRLDVTVEVESDVSGFFQWTAVLKDEFSTELGLASSGNGFFQQGVNSMSFSFSGTAIGANGVDGPYFVSELLLFGAGRSLVVAGAFYETDFLLGQDFEGYIPPTSPPEAICQETILLEVGTVEASFLDNGSSDPDGTALTFTVQDPSIFDVGGVYNDVELTVTDEDGEWDTCTVAAVVIYDPTGGFVTGGGSIESPLGAFAINPQLTGKATFGFVAKYKKGKSTPDGNTQFNFRAGELNFHSTSYEWLVVNQNDSNAQFKGIGRVNGIDGYDFMIWASDDDAADDTFRIKITSLNGVTVYDNGIKQPLTGGKIQIHS